ncbi:MAG: (2Fe-2S) ferredoxin domain-containing protein [Desulfovibrionaceae bacterium]|jgi:(2Fe-2S) ferredoxin|nr:(2Fe-2S) ferredoxin domain-containing protein [Desulfovibrionaceae bacterium]
MASKPTHQILVCQSFRAKGEPQGVCHKKTDGLLQYMEEEVLDRGLDVLITPTGCMKQCEQGPVMAVQPENWWFGGIDSEEAVDAVLDSIEDGAQNGDYAILN